MAGNRVSPKHLIWLGVTGVGVVGGLLLGQFVIGWDGQAGEGSVSYARFSGNPDALGPAATFVEPCYGCDDALGTRPHPKFAREDAMGDEFRELGAVEIDYASEPTSDYRYGGNFDDPEAAPVMPMRPPVAIAATTPENRLSDAREPEIGTPVSPLPAPAEVVSDPAPPQ